MRTMHLFAGVGGGLLADLILGHTPLVAVEWEPYACQVIRERSADGWFPDLQVWEGDVRLFDPSEYTGRVDCIHAGFPCQDISVAGKQAGLAEGTRSGLYREVLRIARIVGPRYVFLENVAAITSKGLDQVVKDMAEMGYDGRWCCLRASDVGAPHQRDRWWGLFVANTHCRNGSTEQECEYQRAKESCGSSTREVEPLMADSAQLQQPIGNTLPETCCPQISESGNSGCSNNLADTCYVNVQGQQSGFLDAQERSGSIFRQVGSCSNGNRWWSVESSVGRVANGIPNRVHRLKGLGNAQVPLQAAVAFKILSKGWID